MICIVLHFIFTILTYVWMMQMRNNVANARGLLSTAVRNIPFA